MNGLLGAADKVEIAEKIHRYAFGVDRRDRSLLSSIARADATVEFGPFFTGAWIGFVEYLIDSHSKLLFHSHAISNIIIEGGDGKASSEAVVLGVLISRQPDNSIMETEFRARHVDKWRYEDGQWMIVERSLARDYRRITKMSEQDYKARYVIH